MQKLLPSKCHPIIVSDAGFRNNWFRLVTSYGWDFVGRARHNTRYKINAEWQPIKELYAKACCRAKFLGEFLLAKSKPLNCYFYLMKEKKKYRVKRNLAGKKMQCSVSLKHAKRGNEPWLIVTSLDSKLFTAKNIMSIYKKRMQIEEAFRDLKNTRLLGIAAKQKNLHYSFQSNPERKRNVLSNFIIGWQVLERRIYLTNAEIINALSELFLGHTI